jgi:hypothetical protein
MSKAEAQAIIKAIQETCNFIMTNGVSIRQAISNTTQDAAFVASLLATYDTAMEQIISDIPDDGE